MATKKENKWEMVEYSVPFDRTETDDVYVSVAGVGSFLLKRGEKVTIPKPIYDVLTESDNLEIQNIKKERQMEAEYLEKSKN